MNKQQADLFKQGTLELLILRLLSSGSLNGWDIMQRIELLSGDVLTITAGALYPALHRLEARGLISAVWRPSDNNRRARFYRLTRSGRRHLQIETNEWQVTTDILASFLARVGS